MRRHFVFLSSCIIEAKSERCQDVRLNYFDLNPGPLGLETNAHLIELMRPDYYTYNEAFHLSNRNR